ncbi:MAG TPA: hypothetical protein VM260_04205, partial [Pirellula sp.]|nr:hypothetical protein [Pirellula sp.]
QLLSRRERGSVASSTLDGKTIRDWCCAQSNACWSCRQPLFVSTTTAPGTGSTAAATPPPAPATDFAPTQPNDIVAIGAKNHSRVRKRVYGFGSHTTTTTTTTAEQKTIAWPTHDASIDSAVLRTWHGGWPTLVKPTKPPPPTAQYANGVSSRTVWVHRGCYPMDRYRLWMEEKQSSDRYRQTYTAQVSRLDPSTLQYIRMERALDELSVLIHQLERERWILLQSEYARSLDAIKTQEPTRWKTDFQPFHDRKRLSLIPAWHEPLVTHLFTGADRASKAQLERDLLDSIHRSMQWLESISSIKRRASTALLSCCYRLMHPDQSSHLLAAHKSRHATGVPLVSKYHELILDRYRQFLDFYYPRTMRATDARDTNDTDIAEYQRLAMQCQCLVIAPISLALSAVTPTQLCL